MKSLKQVKKLVIAMTGFSVLLIGVALIFLPGPAVLVIPAGLAILGTEFVWARRLLKKVETHLLREEPGKTRESAERKGPRDAHRLCR